MTNPNAYFTSLKYAPGLKKEFVLLGENLRQHGAEVRYLVAAPYRQLTDVEAPGMVYLTESANVRAALVDTFKHLRSWERFTGIFRSHPPSFVCCYSFHPLNIFLLRYLKRKWPECATAIYLHEPHKPNKAAYGLLHGTYIYLFERLQSLSLRYADHVILPSRRADALFRTRFPEYAGRIHRAPILVPDNGGPAPTRWRRYFAYSGTVHGATGFDTFIDLVNHSASNGGELEFLAVTSNSIGAYLEELSPAGRGALNLINKPTITDEEIDRALGMSLAVFRLDHEITQSGVVPVGFMNGTPVIARDLPGFTQHVEHGYNGYIVPNPCSPAQLADAVRYVQDRAQDLSRNARRSYEGIWAEENWPRYYDWLLDRLGLDGEPGHPSEE